MFTLDTLKIVIEVYFAIVLLWTVLEGMMNWGFIKNSTNSVVLFIVKVATFVNTIAGYTVTPVLSVINLIPPQLELLAVLFLAWHLI